MIAGLKRKTLFRAQQVNGILAKLAFLTFLAGANRWLTGATVASDTEHNVSASFRVCGSLSNSSSLDMDMDLGLVFVLVWDCVLEFILTLLRRKACSERMVISHVLAGSSFLHRSLSHGAMTSHSFSIV